MENAEFAPGLVMLLNLAILVLVLVVIYLLRTLRKPMQPPTGGGGSPRPEVKQVSIRKDPASGRWQLQSGSGGLAGPIVVNRGDTITWENATNAAVDLQFPSDVLFEDDGNPFPGAKTIDPWIVSISPGQTLQTRVSTKACVSSYVYAVWVRDDSAVTGYAQGGSPPRIIVKNA